jgi:hypothetical protein
MPADRELEDDDSGPLSEKQLALFTGLREVERTGAAVDLAALAARTGYTESSIRTYFTKRLEGVFVFRDPAGTFRVRGTLRCSEQEFARRMTQKAGAANDVLRTEESWRAVLRKLLYEGQRRHYQLAREELELIASVTPEDLSPPGPSEEILRLDLGQPSLFKR